MFAGEVNEYDLQSAVQEARITPKEWRAMNIWDRAMVVAHYRVTKLLELKSAIERQRAIKNAQSNMDWIG